MSRSGSLARSSSAGFYFVLSYPYRPPLPDSPGPAADPWVRGFYDDLCAAVKARARPHTRLDVGFIDYLVPAGIDRDLGLAEALGVAEVFVPLYSPEYFNGRGALRERELFLRRLAQVAPDMSDGRIQPILWTPLVSADHSDDVEHALAVGVGIPEYAESGLGALGRLNSFRGQYTAVLHRLADNIVEVAERQSLPQVTSLRLRDVNERISREMPLIIAVMAPTLAALPPLRDSTSYGTRCGLWRPFAASGGVNAAEFVASVVDIFGLPPCIVDLAGEDSQLHSCPSVILVDPWVVATVDGRERLLAAVAGLPEWVTLMVLIDKADPQYAERGAALAAEVTALLDDAHVRTVRTAQQFSEFKRKAPNVIRQVRDRYLRYGPVYAPRGPRVERPRLADPGSSIPPYPGEDR